MTRKLTLQKADKQFAYLSRLLRNVGQPQDQIREVLSIAAFYRGEIEKRGENWQERVGK